MYPTIPQSRVDEAIRNNKASADRLKKPKRVQQDAVRTDDLPYPTIPQSRVDEAIRNNKAAADRLKNPKPKQTLPIDKMVGSLLVNSPYYKQEKPSYRAADTSFFDPLMNAAVKAVPAMYDASKTVGYNAARLIDEQFPKGFDAIEKGVGIVSDVAKASPLGQVVSTLPYAYDKAKAVGEKAKNIYGQLTKPIPR